MATIKSFTSLEQSRKLAEILPLESADMYFIGHQSIINPKEWEYEDAPKVRGKYIAFDDKRIFYPCWSLAALLNYLREIDFFPEIEADEHSVTMSIRYYDAREGERLNPLHNIMVKAESFIDACYEMILRLHEQKLL